MEYIRVGFVIGIGIYIASLLIKFNLLCDRVKKIATQNTMEGVAVQQATAQACQPEEPASTP